jgi:hypothetical protein
MEEKYNFNIIFEKLEEEKSLLNNFGDSDIQTITEIFEEIEYLKKFCSNDCLTEPITFTRS